jgi:hypothetical protein
MINTTQVVGVAQAVEHRVVAPEVAGSSPVAHPKNIIYFQLLIFLPRPVGDRLGTHIGDITPTSFKDSVTSLAYLWVEDLVL